MPHCFCKMTTAFSDPLTGALDTPDEESGRDSSVSFSDSNDNIIQKDKKFDESVTGEKKFKYDFLVWNHPCNQPQANRIYEEMEKLELRGYISERDKVAGKYKLVAMEEAVKNTGHIILLLSKGALECPEFARKMHTTITSSESSVIPVYIGMKKAEGPRLLRHHVDIQYKNSPSFWTRLHLSITRAKNHDEEYSDIKITSKPVKKDQPSTSSTAAKKNVKLIKVVPENSQKTATHCPPSPKASKQPKGGGLLSRFRQKKSVPKEQPTIAMELMKTK